MMIWAGYAAADEAASLDQACQLSKNTGKPVLMKFDKIGCEFCEKATREMETDQSIKDALKAVVITTIDVDSELGVKLDSSYHIGVYYPVFILTNSDKEIISRWTGFYGAPAFKASLSKALSDLTTVTERKTRMKNNPTVKDALFLAQYSSDISEYLDAITYYREAGKLGRGLSGYSYEIFKATANAIWNDKLEFEDIFPAADSVINARPRLDANIAGMARIMARLARKKNTTHMISTYLSAGVAADQKGRTAQDLEGLNLLQADYALYADNDTVKAVEIRKSFLGNDWNQKPDKYYGFSDWCAERKIDLDEAEYYAREAAKRAVEGEFKGKVLFTLAQICFAQGKIDEAVSLVEQAIEQNPRQDNYYDTLVEYRLKSGR